MATRTLVILEDDIEGGKADESITFAVHGAEYQIDLNAKNAAKFHKDIDKWVAAARRTGGRTRKAAKPKFDEVDNAAVRAWAQSAGLEVNARGRISASVVEAYRAAGN